MHLLRFRAEYVGDTDGDDVDDTIVQNLEYQLEIQ